MVGIVGRRRRKKVGVPQSDRCHATRCLAALLALGLVWPTLGTAQIFGTGVLPVTEIGPSLVQNTWQAARQLISNFNELAMIEHQITSLANEAKHLMQLPLSLVNDIDTAFRTYTDLINTGQGLAFQVKASVAQFEALYAPGGTGTGSFVERAQRMLAQVRDAGRFATQVSAVYDRLCAQQTRVGQLMAASQASVGQLQATQAGNQLMGVLAEQQASIQELLATQQRLQISDSLRQLVMEEQAAANNERWLQGLAVVTIRGPGEGKGFQLTD
jgi:P-type conjugative transfer protein TrbJ